METQVLTSWSGGKDSCFACYRAIASGLKVSHLLNTVTEDGKRSWVHGLPVELLQMQSKAIGIPLVQRPMTMDNYEAEFKDAILTLKQEGVKGGVFGDIDVEEHREWVHRICRQMDIAPYLPLWGQNQESILRDFIDSGFEAVIVVARADLFGEEWLGRRVDQNFLSQLKQQFKMPLCGEAGEYHTFVVNGPLFNQRIEILETNKVLREDYWFLEILRYALRTK